MLIVKVLVDAAVETILALPQINLFTLNVPNPDIIAAVFVLLAYEYNVTSAETLSVTPVLTDNVCEAPVKDIDAHAALAVTVTVFAF